MAITRGILRFSSLLITGRKPDAAMKERKSKNKISRICTTIHNPSKNATVKTMVLYEISIRCGIRRFIVANTRLFCNRPHILLEYNKLKAHCACGGMCRIGKAPLSKSGVRKDLRVRVSLPPPRQTWLARLTRRTRVSS